MTHLLTKPVAFWSAVLLLCAGPALTDDSKLEIHGFLTQAYATADFVEGPLTAATRSPNGLENALGISEDGTTDYRSMAIQFRYEISDRDFMVVQLSHEAAGFSVRDEVNDEIELDWAFYEHRFLNDTIVKVGRIPVPFGIFNEIRDVGTILPFYRPALVVYLEGQFSAESVDGLTIGRSFAADSPWSFNVDLYGGESQGFETPIGDPGTGIESLSDVYGLQLWLNTPVSGLRFGFSAQDRETEGGVFRLPDGTSDEEIWMFSTEGSFARWVFRGEFQNFEASLEPGVLGPFEAVLDFDRWYTQLGFFATEKFHVYAQLEKFEVSQNSPFIVGGGVDFDQREDLGVAINYIFSPQVVLKAEYHEVEQEGAVFQPMPTPQGLRLSPTVLGADGGSYSILALSTSF